MKPRSSGISALSDLATYRRRQEKAGAIIAAAAMVLAGAHRPSIFVQPVKNGERSRGVPLLLCCRPSEVWWYVWALASAVTCKGSQLGGLKRIVICNPLNG
jgi:hypothetical protein